MAIYVVDTSVIIEKAISKLIEKKEIEGRILIPRAVVAELENQANKGQEIGMLGLEELQELQKLVAEKKIEIEFIGERPTLYQVKFAKPRGEIDALIQELAYNEDATLITADKVQAASAKAFGIKVKFLEFEKPISKAEIEKFFDNKTMSVHLKEDCYPTAKKGSPGNWDLVKIDDHKLSSVKVQTMAKEIVEKTRMDPKSFIEISRRGSTIVQYKNYRVVITKPPISDGWEITVVKPLKKLDLADYKLPEQIASRVRKKAHGVIVAGETGAGKSTFAQALAEDYVKQGKIVKTVESPRDLILPEEVTQYSKNFTTSEELHDILFLSRPDSIIFDEIRDTPDFKLYIDLRLAGSNCVGVLHAASPIDAIQRFIGRIDSGMIPSILDTALFIEKGNIGKVYTIEILVKVPTGMTEADLARPIVEVRDFQTGKLEFEIYSYGEQTVVIPIKEEKTPLKELASKSIEKELKKYTDNPKVEILSNHKSIVYVPERDIPRIIGKAGENIEKIERRLGISIDIREFKKQSEQKKEINFDINEKGKYIIFYINQQFASQSIDINLKDRLLFTAIASKQGEIKVHKKSELGRTLLKAIQKKEKINLLL